MNSIYNASKSCFLGLKNVFFSPYQITNNEPSQRLSITNKIVQFFTSFSLYSLSANKSKLKTSVKQEVSLSPSDTHTQNVSKETFNHQSFLKTSYDHSYVKKPLETSPNSNIVLSSPFQQTFQPEWMIQQFNQANILQEKQWILYGLANNVLCNNHQLNLGKIDLYRINENIVIQAPTRAQHLVQFTITSEGEATKLTRYYNRTTNSYSQPQGGENTRNEDASLMEWIVKQLILTNTYRSNTYRSSQPITSYHTAPQVSVASSQAFLADPTGGKIDQFQKKLSFFNLPSEPHLSQQQKINGLKKIADCDEVIAFYKTGITSFLGNFSFSKINMTQWGKSFRCGEAAFQWRKYYLAATIAAQNGNPSLRNALDYLEKQTVNFFNANGEQAFQLNRFFEEHFKGIFAPGWLQGERDKVMWQVINAKVDQNKDINELLEATKGTKSKPIHLLERNDRTGKDRYWSDNGDGTGNNMLGQMFRAKRDGKPIPTPDTKDPLAAVLFKKFPNFKYLNMQF